MKPNPLNVAVLAACGLTSDQADAYIPSLTAAFQRSATFRTATALHSTSTVNGETASSSAEDAFSAFADSLDEDTLFDDEDGDAFGSGDAANLPTWQESLDSLLDPTTPAAKRQILLSDLLNASDEIRESVQDAVANGKVRLAFVCEMCCGIFHSSAVPTLSCENVLLYSKLTLVLCPGLLIFTDRSHPDSYWKETARRYSCRCPSDHNRHPSRDCRGCELWPTYSQQYR